jgi:hypothetical protein
MPKVLRDLLDAQEPGFSLALSRLEKSSGNLGIDARLIGEIHEKVARGIVSLGLDKQDTTGRELYNSLLAKIGRDDERLCENLHISSSSDLSEVAPVLIKKTSSLNMNVFVLKHNVAKKILAQLPPEKLMTYLGYRSVDSMLKHEDVDEIFTLIKITEGQSWQNKYHKLFLQVSPGDFEEREISLLALSREKYSNVHGLSGSVSKFVAKNPHSVLHNKELGIVAVLPSFSRNSRVSSKMNNRGRTLVVLLFLLHYVNEIKLSSSYFKFIQISKNFPELFTKSLKGDLKNVIKIFDDDVSWSAIVNYYSSSSESDFPELFVPQLRQRDFRLISIGSLIAKLGPELKFWEDKDYTGVMRDNLPVVFNIKDINLDYLSGSSYEQRSVDYFRESLRSQIFERYLGNKNIEFLVEGQLEGLIR